MDVQPSISNKSKGTILLVEDDPNDQALTLRALRRGNVDNKIVIANDGAEAVGYLLGDGSGQERGEGSLPLVVILDLRLPKLDGIEVLRRIRADERTRYLPVVIFTSSDEERDRLQAYQFGANSFVRKPIDFACFAAAAAQLGLYWTRTNESLVRKP